MPNHNIIKLLALHNTITKVEELTLLSTPANFKRHLLSRSRD